MATTNGESMTRSDAPKHNIIEIPKAASYPCGSLDFLSELHNEVPLSQQITNSLVRLKVVIAGAGLGGLATAIALTRKGHSVTVFEQAPALGEVGAGIQIPPNSSIHLINWGLEPYLRDKVIEPSSVKFKRWQSGEVIALTQYVPDFREKYEAPYWVVHRAHFHDAMYRLALDLGVEVKINSKIERYEPDAATVVLENGQAHSADLVIGCDGVKSEARKLVLDGVDIPPRMTGFAAYRATIDVEDMKQDPDTAALLTNPSLNLWIGDMRHVMTYLISGGKAFNLVLSHPDSSDPNTWDRSNTIKDMHREFQGWDPVLIKLIGMIKATVKWPLLTGSRLSKWVHSSKKLAIMGDAAHAMVPYMSQGAAMAVEDGAALAEALDLISSPSQLPDALRLWETVRMERAGQMQEASLINGKLWHFADGAEQRARDAGTSAEVNGQPLEKSPNQWSDRLAQRWTYGYDAVGTMALVGQAMGLGRRVTSSFEKTVQVNGSS